MKKFIIALLIFLTVVAVVVVSQIKEAEEPIYEYTIGDTILENDNYCCTIVGTLTNNGADKSYVQISIPFYDAEGNKIGSAYDNVNNLKSGETWKFKAAYYGDLEKGVSVSLENAEIVGY